MTSDPVGHGIAASIARPGGNITGVTGANAELAAKNVELIREILPNTRRIAVLANAPDPFHKPFLAQIENAGRRRRGSTRLSKYPAGEISTRFGGKPTARTSRR